MSGCGGDQAPERIRGMGKYDAWFAGNDPAVYPWLSGVE
jgi:hypothetical protein